MSKSFKIAVIHGDGTGPEVMREGLKVLDVAAKKYGFSYAREDYDLGGERYLRTGEVLPDSVLEELRAQDAIYLSAIGHPDVKPGILEKGILLRLRFELDQYINLRPVKLYPGVKSPLANKGAEHIDFVVVRENTEGLYAGAGGNLKKGTPDEVAIQESINTRKGVDRCLRYAFNIAKERQRKQLTLVGKTNVLTYAFDLWERAFNEMGPKEFPAVKRNYHHVDACCMYMVMAPEMYDVIVTDNMFGDIITDVGAIIQGGLGISASGNLNPDVGGVSMFEPVGGSAPQFTGQNVINPLACINAGAMMLRHLGVADAANAIEGAVAKVCGELPGLNIGETGKGTDEIGDRVAALVAG
ncbi:MAG: 3-isopropylmalate dehydrogenase [Candidatus Sumerlaeota bacterium]|nr:3-isopropylmalate dehydrogenase [Candidatus Sumerlaeota bacterium]